MTQSNEGPVDFKTLLERFPEDRVSFESLAEPNVPVPQPAPSADFKAASLPALSSYHSYFDKSGTSNTCGQAAVAGVADFLGIDIIPPEADGHWDNDTVIQTIIGAGWGPDVALGFGSTGGGIANALTYYGAKNVSCGYVGAGGLACQFGMSWEECWSTVQTWVNAGYPIPVLVDIGTISTGQKPLVGHWPVMIDCGGGTVTLANMTRSAPVKQVSEEVFLRAWNYLLGGVCGFSHCYVTAQR